VGASELRARKSIVEIVGDTVVKRPRTDDPLWWWYFEREVHVYRAFAAKPIVGVRVPRLIEASAERLVIELCAGAPLSERRTPWAVVPAAIVERLIATRAALAAYELAPFRQDAGALRAKLRDRLLEDPTDPVGWIVDGLVRCERRGFLSDAGLLVAALEAHAPVAFGHGDLLLRNVIADRGELVLVDWECAGSHVYDWDLALLYTQLAPASRGPIEAAIGDATPRRAAFRALVAFAFARELRFLAAYPDPPARTEERLRTEIRAVLR